MSPPPCGGGLKTCPPLREAKGASSRIKIQLSEFPAPGRGTREPADFFERKSPSDGLIPPGTSPEGMRNSRPFAKRRGHKSPEPFRKSQICAPPVFETGGARSASSRLKIQCIEFLGDKNEFLRKGSAVPLVPRQGAGELGCDN